MKNYIEHPLRKDCGYPETSPKQLDNFRKLVLKRGFIEDTEIWIYEGKIIDGWMRYQLAQQENSLNARLHFQDCLTRENALLKLLSKNAARKHLTAKQKARIVLRVYEELKAIQKKAPAGDGLRIENLCKNIGVSKSTVYDIRKRELYKLLNHKSIERQARNAKARKRAKERQVAFAELNEDWASPKIDKERQVHNCSCKELANNPKIPIADYIVTDPPYELKYLSAYTELGELAQKKMKMPGVCFAMSLNANLPRHIQEVEKSKGVKYSYTLAIDISKSGISSQNHKTNICVETNWKPFLVFKKSNKAIKNKKIKGSMYDLFRAPPIRKGRTKNHYWAQDLDLMTQYIAAFCKPKSTILEPFSGGGSTAVAALINNCYPICADSQKDFSVKTEQAIMLYRHFMEVAQCGGCGGKFTVKDGVFYCPKCKPKCTWTYGRIYELLSDYGNGKIDFTLAYINTYGIEDFLQVTKDDIEGKEKQTEEDLDILQIIKKDLKDEDKVKKPILTVYYADSDDDFCVTIPKDVNEKPIEWYFF